MAKQFDIVFFGGMGDLALRKLLPAMYRSEVDGEYSDDCRIILTSRQQLDMTVFEAKVKASLGGELEADENADTNWPQFFARLESVSLNISEGGDSWVDFADSFKDREDVLRIFYLSIPPGIYEACSENLSKYKLISKQARIILEKPIGVDLKSAMRINTTVGKFFDEDNIYRIDHYLGKETVQNLLALRFTNILLGDVWDNNSIDHVQISITETVGLEGRAGFYNDVGALRDMVQNHLLQLLCLVAMEPPHEMNADNLRAEKLKVLKALKPINKDNVTQTIIRGQYSEGVLNNQVTSAYVDDLGSDYEGSDIETFVALKAEIGNWRWAGVPFYLRTGKRLKKRAAEILIEFKSLPHAVFPAEFGKVQPNQLRIKLQPDEGIELTLMGKKTHGREVRLKPVTLSFDFADSFDGPVRPAYQRLILDVVDGNSSLFLHREEVEQAWSWITPILDYWETDSDSKPASYSAGSWGPLAADLMIEKDGRSWSEPVSK
jgi:glucose-6-phosphate 1-dehydrogenase